ncbi:MAG TPA: cation-transporting P-type ATPase, partial [Acidobacteriota bacterium]|nr:cation-transporting P-type ATPase [Acidobacteriota bacterium]
YDLTGKGLALEGQFMQNGQPIDPTNCETLKGLLECGVLCNNAHLYRSDEGGVQASGDPLEVALLVAGAKAGIERESLLERLPEVREEAFDSETKMMATFHSHSDNFLVCVKGAAESVLDHCRFLARDGEELPIQEEERSAWLKQNDELAAKGLRVLALARKIVSNKDENPYQDLVFLGLVAMEDPPRSDVKQSIQLCQEAGIRVIMVTGDQPKTARSIAVQVGVVENDEALVIEGKDLKPPEEMTSMEKEKLLSAQIFARVSPRQKLDLIALHQKNGSVVAMTGDGVNDAPALKKADIGVAMGQRGTQVAQQTADMVLQDDAFSTIVVAVQEGRIIFENIRKFVLFLLSCNISEVLIISLASIVRAPLPLTPLQILFLNVVTDVFPALALGVGKGDPSIMNRPPRDPSESILTNRHWRGIAIYGLLITISVLGAFALALNYHDYTVAEAVTVSFLTLSLAQLWHVFNMRDSNSRFIRNDVVQNPFVWGAIVLCILLLLMAVFVPVLANVLSLEILGFDGWILVIVMSFIPLILGQLLIASGRKYLW